MKISELYLPIKRELQEVRVALEKNLPRGEDAVINQIHEHIINARGKRIRPALVFFAAGMFSNGNQEDRITALATAVELIHTATLIHDDVIDEATVRRGQATVNKKWGNQITILAGDKLYAKAMCILARNVSAEIMRILADATDRMCNAEIKQVSNRSNFEMKERDYLEIIEGKTGSFMGACCQAGATLGGAREEEIVALQGYGLNFGMAFQIVDDCLDIIGDEKELGKSVKSDLNDGKMTLPLIFSLDSVSGEEREKLKSLLQQVDAEAHLTQINEIVQASGAIDYSFKRARACIDKAQEDLEIFRENSFKQNLSDLANWVLERKH